MDTKELIRIFFLATLTLMSQLSFAANKYGLEPKEPNVFHLYGEMKVLICDPQADCEEFVMPSVIGGVKKIIAGKFVETSRASWIALTEKHNALCAVGFGSDVVTCKRINIPVLRGIDIDLRKKANTSQSLAFSIVSVEKSQMPKIRKVAESFVQALGIARKNLNDSISPEIQPLAASPGGCSVTSEIQCDDTGGEFPEWPDPEPEPDPCGGCQVVPVPGTPEPEPDPGLPPEPPIDDGGYVEIPISGGEVGAPGKEACKAACYVIYNRVDVPACNRIGSPQGRAICFAAASVKLGICISGC